MSEQGGAHQSAQGSYIAQATSGSTAKVDVTHITYEDVRPRLVDAETLEKALYDLEKLPLDEIPTPASLPHASHMPVRRYNLFVGREENLKALAEDLKAAAEDGEQAATVAVTGMGGVGKSQLVSEFVHRYGQYFSGGVFWLRFADAAVVPAEIAGCGGTGGMDLRADFRHLPVDDQIREVMSAWQSALPRLLVFDNCEEEDLLDQWRPPTGGCQVLLTSRRKQWDPSLGVKVRPLDVLSRKESIALLGKHRPDIPQDDVGLNAIAGELGDLPLAVDLAGRYLHTYSSDVSPEDYLAQLRSSQRLLLRHPSLRQAKGISPTHHEQDVAKTFALSYERLEPDTQGSPDEQAVKLLARKLLARAALFAPGEPIPRELLLKTLELPEEDLEKRLRAADALGRLRELGLLGTQEAGALRMHRLVTAFVRSVVDDTEAQPAVEEALEETTNELLDEGRSELMLVLLPHLKAVTDAAMQSENERIAPLCALLYKCLDMTGAYPEAGPYLERALKIYQTAFGEEHPGTALILNYLAILRSNQGSYHEARNLYERALKIYQTAFGEEHPDTADILNNLGLLLHNQGSYDKAHSLFKHSLVIRQKTYGEEHTATAESLSNLASLLQDQGEYAEARSHYERSLAIVKQTLGEEHPGTALVLNNLASLLQDQGKYEEARPLLESALAISEKSLGREHPTTAQRLNNLAMLLELEHNYDEARSLYERALAICEKVPGREYPDTALILNNLGLLLQAQGRYEEARPYLERALQILQKALGKDHLLVRQSRQNLTTLDTQQREISIGFFRRLIVNAVVGLILLFLTNLFLSDDVPVNLLTLVICAIGGVVGWLLIVILHLLGIAF